MVVCVCVNVNVCHITLQATAADSSGSDISEDTNVSAEDSDAQEWRAYVKEKAANEQSTTLGELTHFCGWCFFQRETNWPYLSQHKLRRQPARLHSDMLPAWVRPQA